MRSDRGKFYNENGWLYCNYKGSITAFLAMIFLLILAVVLTTLEAARVSVVKSCMSMAMSQSMDSSIAKYYLPLMEEYDLFGRYFGEPTSEMIQESLEEELLSRLEIAANPLEGLEDIKGDFHTMLPASPTELQVSNITYLSDYESNALYCEAVEAIKYLGLESGIDMLGDRFKLFKDNAKVSKAFAMQSEAQEKLSKIDKVTLRLMELTDGLTFKKEKLQIDKDKKIKCKEMFIKKYATFPTSMESVKINKFEVYDSLKDQYIDTQTLYSECIATVDLILTYQKEIDELEKAYQMLQEEMEVKKERLRELSNLAQSISSTISSLGARLASLQANVSEDDEGESGKGESDQAIKSLQSQISCELNYLSSVYSEMNSIDESINDLTNAMKEKEDKKKETIKLKKDSIKQYKAQIGKVETDLKSLQSVLTEAIEEAEKGMKEQSEAKDTVKEYESSLDKMRAEISEEVISSFDEELKVMKSYTGESENSEVVNYDFEKMKETFEYNKNLLERQILYVASNPIDEDAKQLEELRNTLSHNQQVMINYSNEGLMFDYRTFTMPDSSTKSAIDGVKDVINTGVLSLVLEDTKKISENKINLASLPSTLSGVMHTELGIAENTESLSIFDQSIVGDLTDSFNKLFGGEGEFTDIAKELVDLGLFQAYMQYYFKDYTKENQPKNETLLYPSVLEYEQEYMCFHKESDKANLTSMVYTLFFVRLVMNLIQIFGDASCNQKARTTAMALVGFTGLAMLVSITKILILTAWAVIEALIDVAVLLQGKDLSLMQFGVHHMKYEELLTISKEMIIKKAKQYRNSTGLALNYDQYLYLFLLLQSKKCKCYSVMDLVQENLNYRYEGGFQLSSCIYGYETELSYRIHNKYALGYSYGDGDGLLIRRKARITY